MNKRAVFTIITITYQRYDLLRQALAAMFRQTYPDIEVIVVDNGATPEIRGYLAQLEGEDRRVKVVHFQENQYRKEAPMDMIRTCLNAALEVAQGDYVFFQSDDDLIAPDFVEKMVALFEGNPECTSAAGYPRSIDMEGRLIDEGPRKSNFRPRYMPGHLLALSTLPQQKFIGSLLFSAPGTIFVFKREDLLKSGGYHQAIELSHLYGIVPFGVTGFDETATLFWRRHPGQTNLEMAANGYIGLQELLLLIKEWRIEERWRVFGTAVAKYVVRQMRHNVLETATNLFAVNLYWFRFKVSFHFLKQLWNKPYFWIKILSALWEEKRQFWYFIRPKLKRAFSAVPESKRPPERSS